MPRRRTPAPTALVCGLRTVPDAARLELLIRTSGGPHDTCRLHHRGCSAADSLFPDPGLDLPRKGRVFAQVVADVLSSLAQTLVAVGHPRAALLKNSIFDRGVDQRNFTRGALAEEKDNLGGAKRRVVLVLDDLDLPPRAHRVETRLDD